MPNILEAEHYDREREPNSRSTLYVCSGDGLGATGKTSIANSLNFHLGRLLPNVTVGHIKEPPIEVFNDFSPYNIVTQGLIASKALAPYLMAIRRMMWDRSRPSPWSVPNTPILIGDRSPASLFYQGAFPGGGNPWQGEFWKTFFPDDVVPFPDILPLLFPDDIRSQIDRLRKRLEKEGTTDQFDDPTKQLNYLEGFSQLSDHLLQFPGVYRLSTGKILMGAEKLDNIDLGFMLALLTAAYAIEKGLSKGISQKYYSPAEKAIRSARIYRIGSQQEISAYLLPLGGVYFSDADYGHYLERLITHMTGRFGDLGIFWPFASAGRMNPYDAVIYALEPGAKELSTQEIHGNLLGELSQRNITEVNETSQYGNNLFTSRFQKIKRGWGNIHWNE